MKRKSKTQKRSSTAAATSKGKTHPETQVGDAAVTRKCASGAPALEDRSDPTKFEPLSVELRQPDSAILLLDCPERPILLQAAAALSNFASKTPRNLHTLFDLNIVDSVCPLVRHPDVFTRRFALKLLALMSAVRNVQAHLLRDDSYIALFTELLAGESDLFLQEFSSRLLAELTGDPAGCAMLVDKLQLGYGANLLLSKLRSDDPDVKRNVTETVANLLGDPLGFDLLTRSEVFSFESIYELFTQPYSIIQQLALDVVERLVMNNAEESIQESFRQSGGVQNLLDVLNHGEWEDLHGKVLHILNLSCDNAKTATLMNSTDGTKRLFSFMELTENDDFKLRSLRILVNLAESIDGRKLLHSRGLIEYLFNYSTDHVEPSVQALICRGIAKMVRYPPAADEILQNNPSSYILSLLNNEKAAWPDRQVAAFTLKELFASDFQNCINFLDSGGQTHLMRIIGLPMEAVPVETRVTIIQAISKIAGYPSLAQDLTNYDLVNTLCAPFEGDWGATDEVKIACCEALSRLPINEEARKLLVHCNALGKLYPLLTDEGSVPVRCAAANLLLLLCTDPLLATLAVHEGYLFYMLKNQSSSSVISTWKACIKALFKADLPMKFAYTGRLSLNDVTEDGFYVMRRLSCPFPILEELFRLKLCPLEPIYVANFSEPRMTEEDDYLESKQAAFNAAREAMRRESMRKGLRVSEGTINAWLELKFGRLQRDPDLQHYLNLFRVELQVAEGTQDCGCENSDNEAAVGKCGQMVARVSRISGRARILGRFVARQLCGTSNPTSGSCVEQQLELHLRAIKSSIENSVIPLGMLRLGSYLERALLFKLIADRIGLPASLVRGRYGKSWVEIAVPAIESVACPDDTQSSSSPRSSCSLTGSSCRCSGVSLPTNYLRENFIVDLMHEPGDLIPIGSTRALKYCDGSPKCEFSCCDYRD